MSIRDQPGSDWIVENVLNDSLKILVASHEVIPETRLPERPLDSERPSRALSQILNRATMLMGFVAKNQPAVGRGLVPRRSWRRSGGAQGPALRVGLHPQDIHGG